MEKLMKKRKKSISKWITKLKSKNIFGSSKNQPYNPNYIPYALKNRKQFYCDQKSPCFKNQGGARFFLLERARRAYETGNFIYEREWLEQPTAN